MKPAVIYVRVSTTQQAAEGVSIDAQLAKAKAWAEFNDYRVVAIHVDEGISGSSTDGREGLELALRDVERCKEHSGEAGVLVVYSLSRLARNTRDTLDIAERLERAGADLVSLSEKIDTTSAAGKMVFRMLAVLAEFERDQISERTSMALAHKKTRGERVGAVPYGMKVAEDGVHVVVDSHEQAIIRIVQDMASCGLGPREICRRLTGLRYETRNGGDWHPTQITRMLGANK